MLEFTIDGAPVRALEGSTILDACRRREGRAASARATRSPEEHLPGVCRGGRRARPRAACSGGEPAWSADRHERARHSRKIVLELLASSVDLSTTPQVAEWIKSTRRSGPFRPGRGPPRRGAEVDNDLYVRDYDKCISATSAWTRAATSGRTPSRSPSRAWLRRRIAVEHDAPLTGSACVYCGNCIEVCRPGPVLQVEFDMRRRYVEESAQSETTTVCVYCGVGCNLTLHVQDNEIVKVTSPHDNR